MINLDRVQIEWHFNDQKKRRRMKTMDFPVKAMTAKLGYWVRVRDKR